METEERREFRDKMRADGLGAMTFLAMLFSLYMIFLYVPTEEVMGHIQRVFYVHLPLAWVAFLAFAVVFIASIAYLATRRMKWDALAVSSAEIGVIFCTLVLITGSVWARKAWNTWWTWDPRLTTTLILWFIYIAYLMLRSFSAHEERGSRVAAVFGIIGFLNVPIVYMAIHWSRTIHPALVTSEGFGLAPPMLAALLINLVTFTLFYLYLLTYRLSLFRLQREVSALKEQYPF